jgi:hypothetical protein
MTTKTPITTMTRGQKVGKKEEEMDQKETLVSQQKVCKTQRKTQNRKEISWKEDQEKEE